MGNTATDENQAARNDVRPYNAAGYAGKNAANQRMLEKSIL
jgi:hypothetical protein